ncbi:MAG: cyclase family protein [Microcoleaceae cyanobacterium MO_207.B10]|nr:cyclase family protein [Microcoleaceae cyanobacterium MO_207.B10]
MGEHSATHINAPNSFYQEKPGIESYSSTSLVVLANVIDIRYKTKLNPDSTLTIDDIKNWENQHQTLSAETLVLLYTGWQ